MNLNRQLGRVAKLLVDAEGICFAEAERRLRVMTLEVRVGAQAAIPAGHAPILTAQAVTWRTFLGGVRVVGELEQRLLSPLSARATLAQAVGDIGTAGFEGPAAVTIAIGEDAAPGAISAWWDGWRAGVNFAGERALGVSDNPLAGVAAGAHAVGAAFQRLRKYTALPADLDLWPGGGAPAFVDVYLPNAIWLMGLGNLGQAFLWNLAALPYAEGAERLVILQDFDRVSEESWGTSILVPDECFGDLKTKMAETWLEARGFEVRRVDRALQVDLTVGDGEPRLARQRVNDCLDRRLYRAEQTVAFVAFRDGSQWLE